MTFGIVAFALGIALCQSLAALPSWPVLAGLAVVGFVLVGIGRRRVFFAWGGALLLGLVWAAGQAQLRLEQRLAVELEGRDLAVTGRIAAMPQRFENGWRFVFEVEQSAVPLPPHLLLAWYQSRHLEEEGQAMPLGLVRAGERWRFTVRLKRPHGNRNPHGYDYEGWLLEQGIGATGYVRSRAGVEKLADFVPGFSSGVERLRESVRDRFQAVLGDRPATGVLVALAVGDQRGIGAAQWRDFSRTGLTHLFSVSGLHITMVAGLAGFLAALFWRRHPGLILRLPTRQAAALAGMATAWAYSLLSGFAVPAQRTFYMLAVVALATLVRRNLAGGPVLAWALGVVLLLDPWAVLAAGFWLSFSAVALLFYVGAARIAPVTGAGGMVRAWGRAQWAMTLGTMPLLLALFQQFSLVAPAANAVAIPLVSFVVTPLALLAAIPGFAFVLPLAAWLTERLLDFCHLLAGSSWAVWHQADPAPWALAAGIAGALWLLAPRGFPARWVGMVLLLPLFLAPPYRPAPGAARFTVLDVGQGLAVHVQTATHDLVFDTGPQFSADANSGNRIIVPYLRALGVNALDTLVVSHADLDHAGGAASVLEELPTARLLHGLPADHVLLDGIADDQRQPCDEGQSWTWDGVRFTVLHPAAAYRAGPARRSNDMSCVLRMDTDHGSALIAADIEARVEAEMLSRLGDRLAADLLVVPHHGSATSSSPGFVAGVGPRHAVFAVGYRNRFGHPRAEVVDRYRTLGAGLWRTDRSGAVTADFSDGGLRFSTERESGRRYWQD